MRASPSSQSGLAGERRFSAEVSYQGNREDATCGRGRQRHTVSQQLHIALPLKPAGLADGLGLGSVLRLIADTPRRWFPRARRVTPGFGTSEGN